MENVNITSIEFDKSMPLWATDDTLDKLSKLLVKETQLSRKDINKLTTIVSKIVTQNKSTASDGKNITKEVAKTDKTLNKILSQLSTLNKNIIKTNQQSSKTGAAQASNNNTQNNKNTTTSAKMSKTTQSEIKHDVNIRMNQALTQQMAFIHKSVSRHSGIMKQVSARFDMSIKRMETVVNRQDKLNAKIGGALERMVGIMGSMTKDGIKIKRTINSTEISKTSNKKVKESKPDGRQFGIMNNISKRLKAPNRDIFNRNSRRFNRNNNVKRRTLSPVRGTPKNPALKALASFGKVIGGVIKTFRTLSKVLGKFNIAAIVVGVAKETYNAMDEVITERRKMLQSGFSFAKEVEGFDGAKLKLTMNTAGVTLERGLKAMEKNATLINKLGVQPFLKTIGDLTADGGLGSLMGDLGMTIPEIDDYASQYMSTLQRLGDSERLREDNRSRATENFIRQADQMGKVTGLGTKAILDNVLKIQQDVKYRIAMNNLDKKQRENMEAFTARMVAFTGGDERAAKAFTMAALDPAGRGLLASEEGQKMHSVFSQAGMGDIFTNFNEFAKNAKNMSSEEQGAYLANMVTDMQSKGESFTPAQKAQLYLLAEQDDKFGGALTLLLNQLDMTDPEKYRDAVKPNLTKTEAEQAARQAALEKAAADKEKLFSTWLDTDAAKGLYSGMSDAVTTSAKLFSKGANGLLDGIKIFIEGFKKLLELLFAPFKRIARFFGFGKDADDIETNMENKTVEHENALEADFEKQAQEAMAKVKAGNDTEQENNKPTPNDAGNVDTTGQNKNEQAPKNNATPKNAGNVVVVDPTDNFEDITRAQNIAFGRDPDYKPPEPEQKTAVVPEQKTVEPEQKTIEVEPIQTNSKEVFQTAVKVMDQEIRNIDGVIRRAELKYYSGTKQLQNREDATEEEKDSFKDLIETSREQIIEARLHRKVLLDMLDEIKRENSMLKNASQ